MNDTLSEDVTQNKQTSIGLYKILILSILFIISVTFALIPIKLSFFKTNMKMIGISNSFSAGIFISVGLVHLLPESTEKFNEITNCTFPFSFFITILGYSLILFIEKIVFMKEDIDERKEQSDIGSDSRQISEYLYSFKDNETDKNEENFKNIFSKTRQLSKCIGNNSGKRSEDTLLEHPFDNQPISYSNNNDLIIDHHSITSYILVIALSVHSIFEGIALGLQRTSIRLFYLFIAISCHKWVEALSIGINFNNSQIDYDTILKFILIFASTTPLGIILGMILSGRSDLIEGFFFAVSSGTFIYISASEVVIEEFSVSKYKKHKFISFIIGAGLIFIFTIFENSQEE